MRRPSYPEEVTQYILEHYSKLGPTQISKDLHDKFSYDLSRIAVAKYCNRHGVHCESMHMYTEEELNWVKSNHQNYNCMSDLTEAYNHVFNQSATVSAMRGLFRRLHIAIRHGRRIGHETQHKNGYTRVKVADNRIKYNWKNWKPKNRIVWEQNYGTIPEGCIIIFLDGKRDNCDIGNLYCLDTKVRGYLIHHKVWKENAPITLTLIKWAELMVVKSGRKLRNTAQLEAFNSRDNS